MTDFPLIFYERLCPWKVLTDPLGRVMHVNSPGTFYVLPNR